MRCRVEKNREPRYQTEKEDAALEVDPSHPNPGYPNGSEISPPNKHFSKTRLHIVSKVK